MDSPGDNREKYGTVANGKSLGLGFAANGAPCAPFLSARAGPSSRVMAILRGSADAQAVRHVRIEGHVA